MIIKGTVVRQRSTLHGTPGVEVLANGFSCNTLELQWAGNQRGVSCTAPGVDRGRVWHSPHLNRLVIKYEDRNGRQDCEQHNGNFAGQAAGETTQVHGCTLVGRGYGGILRKDGTTQWGIKASSTALDELIASLRDLSVPEVIIDKDGYASGYHEVEVEYSWAPGCEPKEEDA